MIVVISDGLDRGSKTSFEKILAELQKLDITVYAVQAQDRTRGAIRRDVPKPKQVIDKLVEGTGGAIFSIEEPAVAAKAICDELRKTATFSPTSFQRSVWRSTKSPGCGRRGNHRARENSATAELESSQRTSAVAMQIELETALV